MGAKMVEFQIHENDTGKLIAVENNKDFPFEIRRVYYIFDTVPNCRRGFHAHKNLKQLLICFSGECKILIDDGKGNKKVFCLNKPNQGLLLDSILWREMYDFKEGTVLGVLASECYSESDYIRDYNAFINYIENGKD